MSTIATLLVSVNSGTPTHGHVTAAVGDSLQFSRLQTDGARTVRYELYGFPPDFACPSGWSSAGGIYYYSGDTPPAVTITEWGKFLPLLRLNGASDTDATGLVDASTGIDVPSATGLHDCATGELAQCGGIDKTIQRDLRVLGATATPSTAGLMSASQVATLNTVKQASEANESKLYSLIQRKQIPLRGRGVSPGAAFAATTDAYGREFWIQGDGVLPAVRFGIGDCLPAGMHIQSFSATIKPASGHASLPNTKPSVTLECVGCGADVGTAFNILATANEWTTTVSDYQASHIIETAPSTPIPIVNLYNYQLVVHGESGDNSKTGLQILSIAIVLTF